MRSALCFTFEGNEGSILKDDRFLVMAGVRLLTSQVEQVASIDGRLVVFGPACLLCQPSKLRGCVGGWQDLGSELRGGFTIPEFGEEPEPRTPRFGGA